MGAFLPEIDNSYIPENAADETNILEGKKARVNHVTIEGTMPNNGKQETWNPIGSEKKTYQAGYYPNSWEVNTENAYNKGKKDSPIVIPNIDTSSWSGGTDGTDTHANITINCTGKTRLTIGSITNSGNGSHSCSITKDSTVICNSVSASNLVYDISGCSSLTFNIGASGGHDYTSYWTKISNIIIS